VGYESTLPFLIYKSMINLRELRKREPERFFILWRQQDPIGFGLARIRASYEEVTSAKKNGSDDYARMRANHIALVRKWTDLCGLEAKQVRKYYYV